VARQGLSFQKACGYQDRTKLASLFDVKAVARRSANAAAPSRESAAAEAGTRR
jgi:hypothetical protein